MRFHIFTATNNKTTAFLDITPCSVIEIYRRFRGAYCFHRLSDDEDSTSETSVYFYETTLRHIQGACYLQYNRTC
jgi:hypothetical protein